MPDRLSPRRPNPIRGRLRAKSAAARASGGRSGFTLVEALVAFTIVALLMIAVQRGAVMAHTGALRADGWMEAERVARTLLAMPAGELGSEVGSRTGRTDGRDWTLTLEPLPLPIVAKRGEDGAPVAWAPMRVSIRVATAGVGTLDLETVRLVKVGPP